MARSKRKHGGDSEVALADKERDTTVVTGLVSHVVDPAVVRMVESACEASDANFLLWQRRRAFVLPGCAAQRAPPLARSGDQNLFGSSR